MIDSSGLRSLAVAMVATVAMAVPAGAQQAQDQLPPLQPAPGQPAPERGERFGDWTKRCEPRPDTPEENCFLTQLVVHQQDEQRHPVLLVAIGYHAGTGKPGAILRVPLALGVFLPSGMTLDVPSVQPVRIAFQSCLPSTGCSGTAPLSEDVIAAMKKATKGTVELQTIRRQTLRLPISFMGFTAGLDALGD